MGYNRDLRVLDAFVQLADTPPWKVIAKALKDEADAKVETLLTKGPEMRPYGMGELAGQAQSLRELLKVAGTAADILAETKSQDAEQE